MNSLIEVGQNKRVSRCKKRKNVYLNVFIALCSGLSCLSSVKQNYVKLLKEGETLLARFEIPRRDGVHIILGNNRFKSASSSHKARSEENRK